MSMTMEQVVTQLQRELFILRAQAAAASGLAEAVRAINNVGTAQVRKDTPSLIDVKGLGRPKEFTGCEEDFQQWSKKTEAFFAGVIKESEMMLEWAAEQPTEITMTAIDLEFLPTDTNEDRGVQNLEFVLLQMHTALMAPTSYEANDIVANSRKNPLEAWRRLQKRYDLTTGGRKRLQKRYDLTTGGRKRNLLRTIISPGRCSLLELQAENGRWESFVSRYEKNMKDKLDDEIKLAGLESLVLEELEKHLILTSNRLRTFEDARLEVVTYVEAKFGLRHRDSKPSDTGFRVHSDPMDVDAVNSLSSGKEKKRSSSPSGVVSAAEHIFNETAMHARTQASKRLAKANRASHGPRVRAKVRVQRTRENAKENPKEPQVPRVRTRATHRKLVSQVLKTPIQRQVRALRNHMSH